MANSEISGGYSRVIKSRLQKKLEVFVNQELPILVEKGYLDVTEFRNVTENCNALVAQLAERGFAHNHQNESENKSPRWDLNPRPKVSAPPFRIMERGITKPSPRKESDTGPVNLRSLQQQQELQQQFCDWLKAQGKTHSTIKQTKNYLKKYGYILYSGNCSEIMALSPRNRHHAMVALASLAKFQGQYARFQQLKKSYNLKWSSVQ